MNHAVHLAMPDGATLFTRHVAARSGAVRGTLLVRTPYGTSTELAQAGTWAGAGFDVWIQDVRGRHASTGQWCPYEHEAQDGVATLRLLTEQGLTRGRILLGGSSYGAHCALAIAKACAASDGPLPGGVVAMVPALGAWETAHAPDGSDRLRDRIGWWLQHGLGPTSRPGATAAGLDFLCRRAHQIGVVELFADPQAIQTTGLGDVEVRRLDQLWRRLWQAPRPDPARQWLPAAMPLLVVSGDHDFFSEEARILASTWAGRASLLTGPWGHGLGTELAAQGTVRQALRRHGGLFGRVRRWVDALDALERHDRESGHGNAPLDDWLRLDPAAGWLPITERNSA